MGKDRREPNDATLGVDRRGLQRGDLVLPKAFADDVQAAGQRGVTETAVALPWEGRPSLIAILTSEAEPARYRDLDRRFLANPVSVS